MRFAIISTALIAIALSTAGESEAASIQGRGWFSSPLSSQKFFGANGYPWQQSSTPGWYVGDVSCSLPKWDGGSAYWCKWWPWSWTTYCRRGNSIKTPAAPRPNNWGWTGKPNWPRPNWNGGNGIKSPIKCTTTATSTITTVLPTAFTTILTNDGNTVAIPTITAATLTSTVVTTETTTTTATSATAVPSTPPPADTCDNGYQLVFKNYTTIADSGVYLGQIVGAAIVAPSYMTYGLSKTAEGCLSVCDNVSGCAFVNAYIDHNDATDEEVGDKYSGVWTCSLFSACESTTAANNWGGQGDPSYITESTGWCKTGKCLL